MARKDDIERLDSFERVLLRPDAFIGSIATLEAHPAFVLDAATGAVVEREVDWNPGLERIFTEILSNAIDNKWKEPPATYIKVTLDRETGEIEVENDGRGIAVEKQTYRVKNRRTGKVIEEELYPGEVAFGDDCSSSNYKDGQQRKTSGRNGIGAKAANVFSASFRVACRDADAHRLFEQAYERNGQDVAEPTVKRDARKTHMVRVRFLPDYPRFGYSQNPLREGYEDVFSLFALRAYEAAMTTGLRVSLNGQALGTRTLVQFSKLFDAAAKRVLLAAPNGDECLVMERADPPELGLAQPLHHSYINGIRTAAGGVHVDPWVKGLVSRVVQGYNSKAKGKKATAQHVYPFLTLFVRAEAFDVAFSAQTKDRCTGPKIQLAEPPDGTAASGASKAFGDLLAQTAARLLKWDFVKALRARLDGGSEPAKAKARKHVCFGDKGVDANWAGKKRAQECHLYGTEGNSAKTLADAGRAAMKAQDWMGTLAFRGKFVNTTNATAACALENKEIQLLKDALGLRDRVDYSKAENRKTLRYGKFVVFSDQDPDGLHIRGLLMNFFYRGWPELYDAGFVVVKNTPVIMAVPKAPAAKGRPPAQRKQAAKRKQPAKTAGGGKVLTWYTETDFDAWSATAPARAKKALRVNYYKGLGSFRKEDAPQIFVHDSKACVMSRDAATPDFMELGFDGKQAAWRKPWIVASLAPPPQDALCEREEGERGAAALHPFVYDGPLTLSEFVDDQLIIYCRVSLPRAIPNMYDGFNSAQRKVMFTLVQKGVKGEIQVERLTGAVYEMTSYHHGPTSVHGTIIGLAQAYPGSNNVPLLERSGLFGSRVEAGHDASDPRYLATKLDPVFSRIFRPEDAPILAMVREADGPPEVRQFAPVVPMLLVNGAVGIGSGFSTEVPSYDPARLVAWVRAWLAGTHAGLPLLAPWYRGHKGRVELVLDKGVPVSWTSRGIVRELKGEGGRGRVWEVTELPVGVPTAKFRAWLEYLETGRPPEKKGAKKPLPRIEPVLYEFLEGQAGDVDEVRIRLRARDAFDPELHLQTLHKAQFLAKTRSLRNIRALDENGYPRKYATVERLLEDFCKWRLGVYARRKAHQLEALARELGRARQKHRFVRLVVDRELELNLPDAELTAAMLGRGLEQEEGSFDYLLALHMRSMTAKKLAELEAEAAALSERRGRLEATPPEALWEAELAELEAHLPE